MNLRWAIFPLLLAGALTVPNIQDTATRLNLPVILSSDEKPRRIVFVSTTGSDTSGDGSLARPWRNLGHAVAEAGTPGTTIYLRGGRYVYATYALRDEAWIRQDAGLGGANGHYLTIEPYSGETVEMVNERIIIDAPWVRVRGLHLTDVGPQIVNWHGHPHHVQLLDNVISGEDLSYGGIETSGDDLLIQGNVITATGLSGLGSESHGIYLGWGSRNVVRNNVITNATGYGIHIYDEDKYPGFKPAYSDVIIEGNTVTGARLRSGLIVSAAAGVTIDGVIIRNNIFAGNNHAGIVIGPYGGTIRNVDVFNNVFYRNGSQAGVGLFVSEGSLSGVRISNNIFDDSANSNCTSNCDWFAGAHISVPAQATQVSVSRNLYWPASIGLSGVTDAQSLVADPLFVAPTLGDFHLQSGSLARNAGLRLPDVPTDRDGVTRPQGTADDLGIYER